MHNIGPCISSKMVYQLASYRMREWPINTSHLEHNNFAQRKIHSSKQILVHDPTLQFQADQLAKNRSQTLSILPSSKV